MNSNLPAPDDTAGVDYLVELGRSIYPTQPPTAGNLMLGLLPYVNCEPLPGGVPLNDLDTLRHFRNLATASGWRTGVVERPGTRVTSLFLHVPRDSEGDEPLGVLRVAHDGDADPSYRVTAYALWLPGLPCDQQVKLTLEQLQWLVWAGPELCSKEV